MLVCAGRRISADDRDTLLNAVLAKPEIARTNREFFGRRRLNYERRKVITVLQNEYAVVDVELEPAVVLASDAATTCVIAVAHCHVTKRASIAHFDESDAAAFRQWIQHMTHPTIHILGDICIPHSIQVLYIPIAGRAQRRASKGSISRALLWFVHELDDVEVSLGLVCVRELNTAEDGSPKCCGMSYDCQTGSVFAQVPDPVYIPAPVARMCFSYHEAIPFRNIYSTERQKIHLKNCQICISGNEQWYLAMSDEQLLRHFSTSPLHEPFDFTISRKCAQPTNRF